MHVAVAEVPPQYDRGPRGDLRHDRRDIINKRRDSRERHGDVHLHRDARADDGLGERLPQRPDRASPRGVVGRRLVKDQVLRRFRGLGQFERRIGRRGAFDDHVTGGSLLQRQANAVNDPLDEFDALVQEEVRGLQRRNLASQDRQQLHRLVHTGHRKQGRDSLRATPHQPDEDGRDDAEGPLAADHQRRPGVAGVVLEQAAEALNHLPVRQHDGQARHPLAHRPVGEGHRPAGVRGDEPADRRTVAGAEIQRQLPAGLGCGSLHRRQRHAGADQEMPGGGVDRPELGQASGADQHLTAARDPASDQAGVAALRDDRGAVLGAQPHHLGDLGGVGGSDDRPASAAVAAREVALVRRAQLRVDQDVLLSDDALQVSDQVHEREYAGSQRLSGNRSVRQRMNMRI